MPISHLIIFDMFNVDRFMQTPVSNKIANVYSCVCSNVIKNFKAINNLCIKYHVKNYVKRQHIYFQTAYHIEAIPIGTPITLIANGRCLQLVRRYAHKDRVHPPSAQNTSIAFSACDLLRGDIDSATEYNKFGESYRKSI